MKYILSTLFICLFAITAQAQTPYISVSPNNGATNTIDFGADFGDVKGFMIGSYDYGADVRGFGIGLGYDYELFKLRDFGINLGSLGIITGAEARGVVLGDTPNKNQDFYLGGRAKAGFNIPISNANLTLTTAYEQFSKGGYWVPLSVGLSL